MEEEVQEDVEEDFVGIPEEDYEGVLAHVEGEDNSVGDVGSRSGARVRTVNRTLSGEH